MYSQLLFPNGAKVTNPESGSASDPDSGFVTCARSGQFYLPWLGLCVRHLSCKQTGKDYFCHWIRAARYYRYRYRQRYFYRVFRVPVLVLVPVTQYRKTVLKMHP